MSVAAMAWAMDQNVPPTPSHVLLILANYADADGVCWPSLGTITSKSRLSERAIRDGLRVLEEAGLIIRLSAGTGGRATSTRYQLQLGKPAAAAGYPKKSRQQAPGNGLDTRHETPGKPVSQPSQKPQYPATGALNPAAGAPEPLRTIRRKEEAPFNPPGGEEKEPVPDWMPSVEWKQWDAYRAGRRWTPLAYNLSIASLDALRRDGNDPAAVIRQAIAGGYTGFVALPRTRAVHRDGFAEVLMDFQQARRASVDAEPLPSANRFLTGSPRRDN